MFSLVLPEIHIEDDPRPTARQNQKRMVGLCDSELVGGCKQLATFSLHFIPPKVATLHLKHLSPNSCKQARWLVVGNTPSCRSTQQSVKNTVL